MNDPSPRWKVACINWGHPSAPHAMTYHLRDGEMHAERYWPTWAEAVTYAEAAAYVEELRAQAGRCARSGHEHDAAGCLDCDCSATPWSPHTPCTCGEAAA